jgi:membrane associated rhomboid family serine protease
MHLLGNVALLWLFAGDSEQHLSPRGVIGCFLVTAVPAVLVGTALSGKSTMGASGGVFGFIGFYCLHMALEHRDTLEFDALTDGGPGKVTFRIYWSVILVALPIALLVALVGQLVGLVPVGRADVVGHLTGLLCGMSYAVAREHL